MKDEQSREIEDSVLDRCSSHGNVVHIYVDRRSPFVSYVNPNRLFTKDWHQCVLSIQRLYFNVV